MWKRGAEISGKRWRHKYGITMGAYLAAAVLTGSAAVLFMRAFGRALSYRLDFETVGAWAWVTTPLLFLASVELIRRFAPNAAGSGIPQAIFAAKELTPELEPSLRPLFSVRTMAVKVAAVLIGIVAWASIGREGPTVHISMCVFMLAMEPFRRWGGVRVEPRSLIIAGGAAASPRPSIPRWRA